MLNLLLHKDFYFLNIFLIILLKYVARQQQNHRFHKIKLCFLFSER